MNDKEDAPPGFYAIPLRKVRREDDGNICRLCDFRQLCQKIPTAWRMKRRYRCSPAGLLDPRSESPRKEMVIFKIGVPLNAEEIEHNLADPGDDLFAAEGQIDLFSAEE